MIYLVSKQLSLFSNTYYNTISVDESLQLLNSCSVLQFDSETNGRDAHVNNLLCVQFGNDDKDFQIVVDCSTIDIKLYKEILESKFIIGQNLKFDLQFLYNYNIVPRFVYDTMIVEQLLHLGYSNRPKDYGFVSVSLKSIVKARLNIELDKTVRGQIIWRGLDTSVIVYAAGDVKYLEKIMWSQVADCQKNKCMVGAKLECNFVPVIAYMEWSGIKLDTEKWKQKMARDQEELKASEAKLNNFVVDYYKQHKVKGESFEVEYDFLCGTTTKGITIYYDLPKDTEIIKDGPKLDIKDETKNCIKHYIRVRSKYPFVYVDMQGDLFTGFNLEPQCTIMWSSSTQVIPYAKFLGFDTNVKDKKTGKNKDSVIEKLLKSQKGINDEFLNLYFSYKEFFKLVSSFGQGHLNAINPNTGRIHTNYKQLGADTGRMSSGSEQTNTDLSKLKGIKACKYPNMQQLPHDKFTRSCFVAEPNNLWVSCDYSAIELVNLSYTYKYLLK